MSIVRKGSGYMLIGASLGLSVVSGSWSYAGFETLIAIPMSGWLGPLVSVSLVALGVAVASDITDKAWKSALVLAVLLVGCGFLDRHSNWLALDTEVKQAEQAASDRSAGYNTAIEALTEIRAEIVSLEAERVLMVADQPDLVKQAQASLTSLGLYHGEIDGVKGRKTFAAMRARGEWIGKRLMKLTELKDKHTETVGAGQLVSEAPFSADDASLYASLVTVLSILLSFAGSWIASSRREIEELYAEADELSAEIIDFTAQLRSS